MNTETPKTERTEQTTTQPSPAPESTDAIPSATLAPSHRPLEINPMNLPDLLENSASVENQKSPYSSFAQFTRDQLLQISAWLDDHIYDKVIDLIKEKYNRDISQSALQRFYA